MRINIFFLCLLMSAASTAYANERVIYYDGTPLNIHVAVGRVSEIILPKKIAKIIKGGVADSILVEVMENTVLLLPKTDDPPDIFVTNTSGDNYPLHLIVSSDYDPKLRVEYAFDDKYTRAHKNVSLELMKVMMQGRVPAQATVLTSTEKRLIAQGAIELTIKTIFELPQYRGYVLYAKNISQDSVVMPLQQLSTPNLLAISSEADVLNKAGDALSSTTVYMVMRND